MRFRKIVSAGLSVLLAASCIPATALAEVVEQDSDDPTDVAIVETETEMATEEEAAEALEEGVEGMPSTEESDEDVEDATGNSETEAELSTMSVDELLETSSRTLKLLSYSGDDRFETAVAVAEGAYPDGVSSGMAIVVSGETTAWPDSLSSSSLAGMLDCPILYVETDSVPDATEDALEELGVDSVVIVGGKSVVDSTVEKDLQGICSNVTRVWGEDRYETQLEVYEFGADVGEWSDNVIIASGSSYADALAVSSIAFAEKMPIFLSDSDDILTDGQMAALMASETESFTIVGGTEAVSEDAEGFLIGVESSISGSYDAFCVERIGGSTRIFTSWEIACWGVENGYVKWNNVGLANAASPVDALCASVLQGTTGAPIILITDDELDLIDDLADKSPSKARIFGGTGVISQVSRNEIAMTLGYSLTQIQGFKVYVDAGHGDNNTGNGVWDSGAVGNGYYEANLTAELAEMVAEELRDDGYEVFLNDDGGPYKYRHAEAIEQDCNVIISIHFNAGGGTGSMTLIHSTNACEYSEYVAEIMQDYLVEGTGLTDRGVREQQVAILSGDLPAALLEVCFIDNSSDMSKYISRKSTVADKIVEGIESL